MGTWMQAMPGRSKQDVSQHERRCMEVDCVLQAGVHTIVACPGLNSHSPAKPNPNLLDEHTVVK
eukprot:4551972-Amphidinium_carterae.1